MKKTLNKEEKCFIRRLVGNEFPALGALEEQLESVLVTKDDEYGSLSFFPLISCPMEVNKKIIGEGVYYDIDDVPVFLILFQKEGYLSNLTIYRADSQNLKSAIQCQAIVAPGYGKGISLDRNNTDKIEF